MSLRKMKCRFPFSTMILLAIIAFSTHPGSCEDKPTPRKVAPDAGTTPSETEVIKDLILANYKALEEKQSELVMSMYHPKTNLRSSVAELDDFFSRMDVKYKIDNIRFIGDDGENYVAIYHEYTEFRKRRGKPELVDKEDTDVLMVFRKHNGQLKIFTSRSLKAGQPD